MVNYSSTGGTAATGSTGGTGGTGAEEQVPGSRPGVKATRTDGGILIEKDPNYRG